MASDSKESTTAFKKGLLQSEELYKYILETSVYPREPEPLKELRKLTETHPRAMMATAADAGQLMTMLLKLVNAKRTIEVGVFTGYSLLLTALTIPDDGKIVAIDMNRESFEIGLPIIKKAGVEHKIDFRESEALPLLDQLLENQGNEGSFDFAYVDADKVNFWNYHERLMKLLRVGGIVVYDNTLWGGSVVMDEESTPEPWRPGRPAIIELNKLLAGDSRIDISHVPVGDGITICRPLVLNFSVKRQWLLIITLKTRLLKNLGLLHSEEPYQYLLETGVSPREPELLKKLRELTASRPSMMSTAPDAGQFLAMLLKLINPKRTIEVGVYTGYSLLLTALSIPEDGKIVAIDVNREHYEMGLPVIKKSGVEHKIDFIESEAVLVLNHLLEDVRMKIIHI